MKYRKRRYFTAAEIAVIWDRWEKGESLNAIARDLGRSHSTIQGLLARTGGVSANLSISLGARLLSSKILFPEFAIA